MRIYAILLVMLGMVVGSLGLFRSSLRGIATVDQDTGDIVWVPMPGDIERNMIANKRVVSDAYSADRTNQNDK
ncbi:unnamed protein product [Cylicocyclus nassatus]|uniref:Uncharacterized protein n=1 Tax=Cylicocyclus nassatus TaxID=53992 RepID=A0AA36GKB5_CYLNA|nr:unnamed protein product [Cylicocyclus nassatus]